jgi:hypothetical protein
MDCEKFRLELLTDPAAGNRELEDHEAACVACGAYAQRARRAEGLIVSALRFEVATAKASGAGAKRKRLPRVISGGVAAAIVAAVVLGLGQSFLSSNNAIAGEFAEHWHHEPYSWVATDQQVALTELQRVVAGKVVLDHNQLPSITYASLCLFRGEWVPHLVVQGQKGPVMVMLLPSEGVWKPTIVELVEENLEGIVVPHGQGSIAILGNQGEELESLQKSLSRAVEWSI